MIIISFRFFNEATRAPAMKNQAAKNCWPKWLPENVYVLTGNRPHFVAGRQSGGVKMVVEM
jgi:hypothetical protein